MERSDLRENVLVNNVILQFRRWKQQLFRLYVVLPICVGLVTLGFLLPSLIGAGYMMLGNQALATGEASVAVQYLQQARTWSPASPGVYRSLAQAYLLLDQPAPVVAALEDAYRLRPDSLLIQQELAQAYEAADAIEQAYTLWETAGVTVEQMVAVGDDYLFSGNPDQALVWYTRVLERTFDISSSLAFRIGVAAIAVGETEQFDTVIAQVPALQSDAVWTLTDKPLRIAAPNLRWLFPRTMPNDAAFLHESSGPDPTLGALWWNGTSIAVLDVAVPGTYIFTVRAQESQPGPIQLGIEVNQIMVARWVLAKTDNTWGDFEVRVSLRAGLNIIGVRFLSDGGVGSLDRNAFLKWVDLRKAD